MKKWLLVNTILFVLAFLSLTRAQDSTPSDTLKKGDLAPTFSLPDLDNTYIFLRDFSGTELRKPWINKTKYVVVLSFFATWCGPCKQEIPFLEQLRQEYKSKPIKFYLIDVGEEPEKVKPFVTNSSIKIPVLIDRYMQTAQKYGAQSLPRLVVIDQDGSIVKLKRGFKNGELFLQEMREVIGPLLTQ